MSDLADISVARRLAADGSARALRISARLSIYDVARQVQVGASTISRWERGQRVPRNGAALTRYAILLKELAVLTGKWS